MRILINATVLCFLLLLGCKEEHSATLFEGKEMDIESEMQVLRHLKEVEWPQAYREQDTVLLGRILGDDFQMVSADGTWSDKAGQIARIKASPMDNDLFEFEIKRLEVFENGTAIVAGTGHVLNDGKEMNYQSSNVLIKRGDQWKAVLSHVSGITELDTPHDHSDSRLPYEADFSYLIGDWKRSNEAAEKETFEQWRKLSDTEYVGLGYTLARGDTVWKETIRLARETDHWDFEVLGQGDSVTTPFKVTRAGKLGFECYNPVNDFPKTIRYERKGDSLYAIITDGKTEVPFTFVKTGS